MILEQYVCTLSIFSSQIAFATLAYNNDKEINSNRKFERKSKNSKKTRNEIGKMGDRKHENCVAYAIPIKSISTPVFNPKIVDYKKKERIKTCTFNVEHSIVGERMRFELTLDE